MPELIVWSCRVRGVKHAWQNDACYITVFVHSVKAEGAHDVDPFSQHDHRFLATTYGWMGCCGCQSASFCSSICIRADLHESPNKREAKTTIKEALLHEPWQRVRFEYTQPAFSTIVVPACQTVFSLRALWKEAYVELQSILRQASAHVQSFLNSTASVLIYINGTDAISVVIYLFNQGRIYPTCRYLAMLQGWADNLVQEHR